MLFPSLTSNPNIRKLSFFLYSLRRQPTAPGSGEPTSRLQQCEDMVILFGTGNQAGWLVSLLAERGRGLSGKRVLMTVLLWVAEDLGRGMSNRCSN